MGVTRVQQRSVLPAGLSPELSRGVGALQRVVAGTVPQWDELAGGTVRSVRPAKGSPAGRAFHGELNLNPVIRHARVQFVCKGVLAEQWRAGEAMRMLCLHGWLTPWYGGSVQHGLR